MLGCFDTLMKIMRFLTLAFIEVLTMDGWIGISSDKLLSTDMSLAVHVVGFYL